MSERFAFVTPKKRFMRLVLHKLKLQSHTSLRAVEERAELLRSEIVLHVARVPVVRDVEDRNARAPLVLLAAKGNGESFRHEQIEGHQRRKAAAFVTWTNKILLIVQQ